MSFLRVFTSVLHAIETAAVIAAPVVKAVDPDIGNLMQMATTAAVGVEGAITAPAKGDQKAQIVADQVKATVGVINAILTSQGKAPLPANVVDAVTGQVKVVVGALNVVADTVDPAGRTQPSTPAA